MSTPATRVNGVTMVNTAYAGGNVTSQLGNVGASPSAYAIVGSLTPTDPNGASTWYETTGGSVFFGVQRDWVYDMGWNLGCNGTQVDPTKAAIGDQWESNYVADATHTWVERHFIFIGADGTYQRPLTMQAQAVAGGANPIGYTNFGIAADVIWFSGKSISATQNFVMANPTSNASGQFQVANSSQIRLLTNNIPQLVQMNAASSGTYTLAYVDASNTVNLGDTTTLVQVKGTTTTIDSTSATQIGPNAGNVNIGGAGNYTQFLSGAGMFFGGPTATSGAQTKNSPTVTLRAAYWNGSTSVNDDANLTHITDSTTPTSHLALQIAGATMLNFTSGGAIGQKVGSSIASATTIAPTAAITHITGTTTIQTITAPNQFATSGQGGRLTLIFDGVSPWNAAGNIAVAGTPTTAGTSVDFTYDNATSKWYPSRIA